MRHIVIDLEMNGIGKGHSKIREICYQEIIQIGAILLDEEYKEISQFQVLVKPQYNTGIQEKITKLTSITTEMVKNAPDFSEALSDFLSWCKKCSNAEIYAWSDSDRAQLCKEIELKEISLCEEDANLIDGIIDFQLEFNRMLNLENSISLENALSYAGIDFSGHQHDALDDARNTAALLRVVRTPKLRTNALENVINILKPKKSIGATMGDLFRFSDFEMSE